MAILLRSTVYCSSRMVAVLPTAAWIAACHCLGVRHPIPLWRLLIVGTQLSGVRMRRERRVGSKVGARRRSDARRLRELAIVGECSGHDWGGDVGGEGGGGEVGESLRILPNEVHAKRGVGSGEDSSRRL